MPRRCRRPPRLQIVNGPEILNKFVGQSEENIRNLFADAEKEQAERGDESDLHIIIFDEIDAICAYGTARAAGGRWGARGTGCGTLMRRAPAQAGSAARRAAAPASTTPS